MKTYITYGKGNVLDTSRIPDLKDLDLQPNFINKVDHAFWGSPINANFGWKDWCYDNNFHTSSFNTSFKWTVKDDSRIGLIKNLSDLDILPFVQNPYTGIIQMINFQEVAKQYDAIELCVDLIYFGHCFINEKEQAFNSWDCDSIMVLNKDIIIPVKE